MSYIDCIEYWPQLKLGEILTMTFDPLLTYRYTFDTAHQAYRLDEFDEKSNWKCAWLYTVEGRVLEIGDIYPVGFPTLLGPRVGMLSKPIPWGGHFEEIGVPMIDDLKQRGLFGARGKNVLTIVSNTEKISLPQGAMFFDCLKLHRVETWKQRRESIYYMAKGLGFVGMEWVDGANLYTQKLVKIERIGGK